MTLSVWFMCKLCGGSFQKVDQFIQHKRQWHFKEFQNTSCIIFEEKSVTQNYEDGENFESQIAVDTGGSGTPAVNSSDNNCDDLQPGPVSNVEIKAEFLQRAQRQTLIQNQSQNQSTETNVDAISVIPNDQFIIHFQQLPHYLADPVALIDAGINFASEADALPTREAEAETENTIIPNSVEVDDLNLRIIQPQTELAIFKEVAKNEISCANKTPYNPFVLIRRLTPTRDEIQGCETISACNSSSTSCSVSKIEGGTESEPRPGPEPGLGRFKCSHPNCAKIFKTRWSLRNHFTVHSDQKQFKCAYPGCSKAFKSKGSLSEHLAVHTGVRQTFSCKICHRHFFQKSTLNRHFMVVHSQDRPFKCTKDGCLATFKCKDSLTKHERSLLHSKISKGE